MHRKIKLTITINFISSKDIKSTSYSDVNEVINELLESFLLRY